MSKVKIIENKLRPKLLIVNIDQIFPRAPPQLYNWAVLHPLRSLLCSLSVVWSSWATLRPSAASALTRRWWSRCVGQPSVSCVRYASSSTSSWSLWPSWLSWMISWRSVSCRAHFVWESLDGFLLFGKSLKFYLCLFIFIQIKKKNSIRAFSQSWGTCGCQIATWLAAITWCCLLRWSKRLAGAASVDSSRQWLLSLAAATTATAAPPGGLIKKWTKNAPLSKKCWIWCECSLTQQAWEIGKPIEMFPRCVGSISCIHLVKKPSESVWRGKENFGRWLDESPLYLIQVDQFRFDASSWNRQLQLKAVFN